MAEGLPRNPEGMAQNEPEEVKMTPERVEAKEVAVESPEQKQEREYRENSARLLARAEEYFREEREKRLPVELSQVSAAELAPLPTLADVQVEWKKDRDNSGIVTKLKESFKRAQLRLAGIESPDDLMALTHYLEENLINQEHETVHVKSSRKDSEIEKYKRKGYEVHEVHASYQKGKVQFTIEKETPYRVSSKKEKDLSELLGKANDPVTMIERLKRVGFRIDAHAIQYHLDALGDFVASSEINDVLEKLDQAGIQSEHLYFGYGHDDARRFGYAGNYVADLIKEYALDPRSQEEMSKENMQRIAQLKQLGFGVTFGDHWDEVIKMVSDDDMYTLLTFMGGGQRVKGLHSSYRKDEWETTTMLHDAELATDFAEIIRTSPWLARELLNELFGAGYFQYSWEERKAKKIEKATALLTLPVVQELGADPALAEFVADAATLLDDKLSLENVEVYKALREYPATLPFLELCRELGIFPHLSHYQGLKDLHEILQNQQKLGDIFRPEFRAFVLQIKDAFGYQMRFIDFYRSDVHIYSDDIRTVDGQILGLFRSPLWREGMASGRAPELIQKFGAFQMRHLDFYTRLLKVPNSLEVLNQLEQKFQFDLTNVLTDSGTRFDIYGLEQLCTQERMRNKLFDERTVALYRRLKEIFGYPLNFYDIESLLEISRDEELQAQLFDEENVSFIKETFQRDGSGIFSSSEQLKVIKEIDPAVKPLLRTLAHDFHFYINTQYRNFVPQLQSIAENEETILGTARTLQECGFSFYLMGNIPKILEIVDNDLLAIFVRFKDQPNLHRFLWDNVDTLSHVPPEKRDDYIEIFLTIDNSPSQEIQRLKNSLLGQLLDTDDPVGSYRKIEDVFVKNNLPAVGKIYKIFEILHPPTEIENKLKRGTPGSPTLTAVGTRRRSSIIYSDLLRTHADSANRSLRQYIETLQNGEELLGRVDTAGIGALSADEQKKFGYILEKFHTLFFNSTLGKNVEAVRDEMTLAEHYQYLRDSLGVREGSSLTARIAEMFLRPLGAQNLEEVLVRMQEKKTAAHERNLEFCKSYPDGFILREGDLLKGTPSQYVPGILQNGSVAKEFLGSEAQSDQTPLDTDVSRVTAEDAQSGFAGAVQNSMAGQYGNLIFALRDRGQFQHTEPGGDAPYDRQHMELFPTGGGKHYGIRTGFPSTEIDFMIARESLMREPRSLEKMYYEVAQNGWYVPVCDSSGHVMFTPDMYAEYRQTFNGLDRFDGEALEVAGIDADDSLQQRLRQVWETKQRDQEKLSEVSSGIRETVIKTLEELDVRIKEEHDASIIGAQFLDIGSTGRNTNTPGSYDFDFILTLDQGDFSHAEEIAAKVKERFVLTEDKSHPEVGGYYQLRAMGVSRIGDLVLENPVDIDIGFGKKSDPAEFGSHSAVSEKLEWVRKNRGEELYQQTVATIVLTKELLNAGNAYKRVEHGGFGGIGVENWILYHNGNIREAFQSFWDAAHEDGTRIPLEQFKKKYKILDPGMNLKNPYHDNFIESLKPEGYERMLAVIENFLQNQ